MKIKLKLLAGTVLAGCLALPTWAQKDPNPTPMGADKEIHEFNNVLVKNFQDESLGRIKDLGIDLVNGRIVEVLVTCDSSLLMIEIGTSIGDGTRQVRLLGDVDPLDAVAAAGQVPLPPYITAPLADPERYQTVYSRRVASAAAPTAGLHLTPRVLDELAGRDIGLARVELVVGLDTFKPLIVDDPADHVMHAEAYRVEPHVLEQCRATRAAGGRVVAIGTTATRALESAARLGPNGRTTLFIRRPYDWQVVDVLLTNFHLPRSTLLLMIDAFVGPRWRALYECALAEHYRFLSFGDAMLLERNVR